MNKFFICAIWLLAAATGDGVVTPASSMTLVNPSATGSPAVSPNAKLVTHKPEYRPSSSPSSPTPSSDTPDSGPQLGNQGVVVKSLLPADSTESSKLKTVSATSAHVGKSNFTRFSVNGTAGTKWKRNSAGSVDTDGDVPKLPKTRSANKTTASNMRTTEVSAGEEGELDGQQMMIAGDVIVKGTSAPTPMPKTTSAAVSTRATSSHTEFITLGAVLVSAIATLAW